MEMFFITVWDKILCHIPKVAHYTNEALNIRGRRFRKENKEEGVSGVLLLPENTLLFIENV